MHAAVVCLLFRGIGFAPVMALAAAGVTVPAVWALHGLLSAIQGRWRFAEAMDLPLVILAGAVLGFAAGMLFGALLSMADAGLFFGLLLGCPIGVVLALISESIWRGLASSERPGG